MLNVRVVLLKVFIYMIIGKNLLHNENKSQVRSLSVKNNKRTTSQQHKKKEKIESQPTAAIKLPN